MHPDLSALVLRITQARSELGYRWAFTKNAGVEFGKSEIVHCCALQNAGYVNEKVDGETDSPERMLA
ncbi:hypothetical protein PM082_002038 [Marasmius tenuissimus]|nr:hypothetical protein PM082_002038 [Marasmius tenuissimus]